MARSSSPFRTSPTATSTASSSPTRSFRRPARRASRPARRPGIVGGGFTAVISTNGDGRDSDVQHARGPHGGRVRRLLRRRRSFAASATWERSDLCRITDHPSLQCRLARGGTEPTAACCVGLFGAPGRPGLPSQRSDGGVFTFGTIPFCGSPAPSAEPTRGRCRARRLTGRLLGGRF